MFQWLSKAYWNSAISATSASRSEWPDANVQVWWSTYEKSQNIGNWKLWIAINCLILCTEKKNEFLAT